MKQIQSYATSEDGFFPLLLTQGWQVAILNFFDGVQIDAIDRIEVHHDTDEAFILHKGRAVLIIAQITNNTAGNWEVQHMHSGVIYNIPRGCWHAIAMEKNASVFIVEKRDTHKNDVVYHQLSKASRETMQDLVKAVLYI